MYFGPVFIGTDMISSQHAIAYTHTATYDYVCMFPRDCMGPDGRWTIVLRLVLFPELQYEMAVVDSLGSLLSYLVFCVNT